MRSFILIGALLLILSLKSYSQGSHQELNCFSILAGKEATIDGSVMFAHNEDDWGDRIVNWYKVPASEKKPSYNKRYKVSKKLSKNQSSIMSEPTWSYLWLEMPEMEFSDTYMNQWGVTISSDACKSREDKPDLKGDGIGYLLRTKMAREARSAREAVKIGGALVNAFGYASAGRTYCIADPTEAWMLSVVNGKHWVAQRIPDDHVAVIPNYYTITSIDLKDTLNFYGSKNLVEYATKRGWYNPATDGEFNFRRAYGAEESLFNSNNITRHWSALNLLSGKAYKIDDDFPFSFKPPERIGLQELFEVLRNHNENTPFDYSENYSLGHPHNFDKTICAETTQYGFVAQLRGNMPPEIGFVMWLAPYRPCIRPFVPWYFGVSEIPEGFYTSDYIDAFEKHFDPIEEVFHSAPGNTFLKFVKHARAFDEEYGMKIGNAREVFGMVENELLLNQTVFENEIQALLEKNSEIAIETLNKFLADKLQQSYEIVKLY